jgi:hypothetical protein
VPEQGPPLDDWILLDFYSIDMLTRCGYGASRQPIAGGWAGERRLAADADRPHRVQDRRIDA